MPNIVAVLGDITKQDVDAVVNAAHPSMRGTAGGVDRAIHREGGRAVLAECVARYPHGLKPGEAGATTAGALPARWVIHAVGPKYTGEHDRP